MKIFFRTTAIALLCLISTAGQAQLRFGLKGGLNVSSVHFNQSIFESSNLTGFQVGPTIELMAPMLGIGFDAALLYTQKGCHIKEGDYEAKQNYLDIPVNLKWKFGLPIAKVYVAGGPYVGFRLNGEKFWSIPGLIDSELKAKSFNAGINLGAGVELIKHLQVGLIYRLGLTEDYSVSKLDLNGKNRGLSATVALMF